MAQLKTPEDIERADILLERSCTDPARWIRGTDPNNTMRKQNSAAEVKFLRAVMVSHIRNQTIGQELNIFNILDK